MNDRTSLIYLFSFSKIFGKKTKKQVDPLKSLNLSNKIDELKQIESIFPQNQMNDLILDKLKEIKQLQDNIELNELDYKAKCKKNI